MTAQQQAASNADQLLRIPEAVSVKTAAPPHPCPYCVYGTVRTRRSRLHPYGKFIPCPHCQGSGTATNEQSRGEDDDSGNTGLHHQHL